ncbi:MAG TPA: hypothetical protein VKE29_07145 [Candidatus Udaeobacter sp.]|jgi:hypothetical protein|nr:hypothetical protein [Candidatus Udaeobacter sp.]
MTAGEGYRAKAGELLARAEVESSSLLKAEFESLAAAYLRLAEQAERNNAFIVEFELPRKEKSKP